MPLQGGAGGFCFAVDYRLNAIVRVVDVDLPIPLPRREKVPMQVRKYRPEVSVSGDPVSAFIRVGNVAHGRVEVCHGYGVMRQGRQ